MYGTSIARRIGRGLKGLVLAARGDARSQPHAPGPQLSSVRCCEGYFAGS